MGHRGEPALGEGLGKHSLKFHHDSAPVFADEDARIDKLGVGDFSVGLNSTRVVFNGRRITRDESKPPNRR